MLISLHLPKTAGSSFASSLNEHFGEHLLRDYNDFPLHKSPYQRNKHALIESTHNYFNNFKSTGCIHGHFLPLKYRFLKSHSNTKFVTWMRDPAERLASQYYYMMRQYTVAKADKQHLLKTMVDENWSLERFCLGTEFKNTYSKFLWGFPLRKFDFIGIVEHYDDDFSYFSKNILNSKLRKYQENVNPLPTRNSYFKDPKLKNEINEFHSKDVTLYKKAISIRQLRFR